MKSRTLKELKHIAREALKKDLIMKTEVLKEA